MNDFSELVCATRSIRRFYEDQPISLTTLTKLVDLARLGPSGGNAQPLKYAITCTPGDNQKVFQHLMWAGYLSDWDGPIQGERPAGYIVILHDTTIAESCGCDHGIAATNIVLGARSVGLGACIFGSISRTALMQALDIEEKRFKVALVVALGHPKETVQIEPTEPNGSIKYWRDEQGVHHVPKRPLDEIIL